jgi:hypothetical protein
MARRRVKHPLLSLVCGAFARRLLLDGRLLPCEAGRTVTDRIGSGVSLRGYTDDFARASP